MTADAGEQARVQRSPGDHGEGVTTPWQDRTPDVGYRAALEAVGAVAAPLSVVTALAYYIGVQRQTALAGTLGLDVSVLGLSTRDYVVRSTDTLVRFLAVGFVAGLALTALAVGVRRHLAAQPVRLRHRAALAALVAGGVLLVYAVFRLFNPVTLRYLSLLHPVSLMAGAALSTAGLAGLRQGGPDRAPVDGAWARLPIAIAAVGLLLLGLFWAANDYAALQGRQRGLQLLARVDALPQATIYSRAPLHTTSDAVEEEALTAPDGLRTYRYEGLRLLLRSDGKYFLLPAEPSGGPHVVVLSEDDVSWIELRP